MVGSPNSPEAREQAATLTMGRTPSRRAFRLLTSITAAAPSEVAHISSRRRGSHTMGEARTCSRVKALW